MELSVPTVESGLKIGMGYTWGLTPGPRSKGPLIGLRFKAYKLQAHISVWPKVKNIGHKI